MPLKVRLSDYDLYSCDMVFIFLTNFMPYTDKTNAIMNEVHAKNTYSCSAAHPPKKSDKRTETMIKTKWMFCIPTLSPFRILFEVNAF